MTAAPSKFRAADFWSALLSSYSYIGLNTLLQIALVPLYLRNFEKSDFGLLMILLSAVNFLTFGIYGLTGNVLRVLTEHAVRGDTAEFARSYTRARLLFGLYTCAAAICAIILFLVWPSIGNPGYSLDESVIWATVFAAGQIVLNAELGVVRLALSALQRQSAANLFQIIGLAIFAVLVMLWLALGSGIGGVLGALFISTLVARLCAGLYVRVTRLPLRWSRESRPVHGAAQEYLRPIGLVYLVYGAIFVTAQSDTFLLGWLTHPDIAAEFVLLWRIPEAMILLLSRIPEHAQVGFLYLHKAGRGPEFARFCARVSFWLQALALGVALVYGLFGRWIVSVWVGPDAAPSNPWGYALAGGAIFWLTYARLPAAFANMQGTTHIKRLTQITGAELFLKIVLLLALYDRVHELSPIVATNAVHALAFYYIYRRFLRTLVAPSPTDARPSPV